MSTSPTDSRSSRVSRVEPPLTSSSSGSWIALCVAAAAMVGTLPGRTPGLGLITEPLLADLQLSRVDYGQINLWATLIGALFCFPAERLLDRFGPRIMVAATAAALGVVAAAMSRVDSAAAMFWLITLTRGLGQSALTVVSIALVGKSFDRRAVWPMAAYSVLMSIGFMITFPTVQYLVKYHGWRDPWGGVGLSLVGFAIAAWFALPRTTRQLGAAESAADEATATGDGLTLREALATPLFWTFAAGTSLFGLAYAGLGIFNEDILKLRGLDAYYGHSLGVTAICGLAGQAACGLGAKFMSYQRLTTIALALYAGGLISLARIIDVNQLYAASALLGASGGMITVIFFAVWSRHFGRLQLGRIQGVAQMLSVFASGIGPLLYAACRDRTGSYDMILFVLAAVVTAVGGIAWFIRAPVRYGA